MSFVFPAPSPIGSVLPSLPPGLPPLGAASLWALWTSSHRGGAAFVSARAALAALLDCRRIRRLWLPAYCCASLAEAASDVEVLWYGIGAGLAPDPDAIAAGACVGDAVLSVAFFGVPAGAPMRALAALRQDLLWIEDRSQAVDAGGPAWADVHLHSPRKLIGVGDGDLLLSDGCLPPPSESPVHRPIHAQMARRNDPLGRSPASWFQAFRRQEAAFGTERAPMSAATYRNLRATAAAPIVAARTANAAFLHSRLRSIALWPESLSSVPLLAFPVLVPDAAAAAAALSARGIHCARHWASLPSPPESFPEAHALSARLLSLPCDQHYDVRHMARVADRVTSLGLLPGHPAPTPAPLQEAFA